MSRGPLPRYDELPALSVGASGTRSTWGLFGADDEAGTINLLQPDLVRRATSLVRWGTVFSLDRPLTRPDPPLAGQRAYRHVVQDLGSGTDDYLDDFHPRRSSHWNALRQAGHPEHGYYNGLSLDDATGLGVPRLGIDRWARRGIVGRYVLIDVDRHRAAIGERSQADEAVAIGVDELDEALLRQGTAIEHGDVLLLRSGWTTWYEGLTAAERASVADEDQLAVMGLSPEEATLEWLWDHRIAAVVSDAPTVEATPPGRPVPGSATLACQLASLLGMATGGLFMLDELADDCVVDAVYDGLFVAAPLHVPGGSGSPANAIAIK